MTLKEITENWFQDLETDLKKSYDGKIQTGFGKWKKSLETTEIKEVAGHVSGQLLSANYTYFMEYGRGSTKKKEAGNPTLREIIREWIDDRGIIPRDNISRDSLAYLITRKIHKKGTKGKNIVTPVITDKRIQLLFDELSKAILDKSFEFVKLSATKGYTSPPKFI